MNLTTADALTATAPPLPFLPGIDWGTLVEQRGYLVRYAQRKLRDPLLAEDAVHDVFEAVLSGRAVFAGRCALRSWLTAVLKNKIVDTVRRNTGFESSPGLHADGEDDDGALAIACPQPGPEQIVEQREQLRRTLQRIDDMAPGLRDVMRRRVIDEQPTEVVCRELGITEDNLFVRLHRARKQLAS